MCCSKVLSFYLKLKKQTKKAPNLYFVVYFITEEKT